MTQDDKQFTDNLHDYPAGASAVGFDGSRLDLGRAGSIGNIGPVFAAPQCTDTLIPTSATDGTDAQWVLNPDGAFLTSGITFHQRPDGLYDRGDDSRPGLSAKVAMRSGPGQLYQMGNLLSTQQSTVHEQTLPANTAMINNNNIPATTPQQHQQQTQPHTNDYHDLVTFNRLGELNDEFSNAFPSPFLLSGQVYCCVGQRLAHQKALLMGDDVTAGLVLQTNDPVTHHGLGLKIAHFNVGLWQVECWSVLTDALRCKFNQHPALAAKLQSTFPRHLANACSTDLIFGTGVTADDVDIWRPETWTGQNLLGRGLEIVRAEMRNADPILPNHPLEPPPDTNFNTDDVPPVPTHGDHDHQQPSLSRTIPSLALHHQRPPSDGAPQHEHLNALLPPQLIEQTPPPSVYQPGDRVQYQKDKDNWLPAIVHHNINNLQFDLNLGWGEHTVKAMHNMRHNLNELFTKGQRVTYHHRRTNRQIPGTITTDTDHDFDHYIVTLDNGCVNDTAANRLASGEPLQPELDDHTHSATITTHSDITTTTLNNELSPVKYDPYRQFTSDELSGRTTIEVRSAMLGWVPATIMHHNQHKSTPTYFGISVRGGQTSITHRSQLRPSSTNEIWLGSDDGTRQPIIAWTKLRHSYHPGQICWRAPVYNVSLLPQPDPLPDVSCLCPNDEDAAKCTTRSLRTRNRVASPTQSDCDGKDTHHQHYHQDHHRHSTTNTHPGTTNHQDSELLQEGQTLVYDADLARLRPINGTPDVYPPGRT